MKKMILGIALAGVCVTSARADEEAERIRASIDALESSLVRVVYTYEKTRTSVRLMLDDSMGGTRESEGEGVCSGLVLDDDGLVLVGGHIFPDPYSTNMHFGAMVRGQSSSPPKSFEVVTQDGVKRPARLLVRDEGLNLAYLKVDDPPESFRPVTFDFESELGVGDPFIIVTFLSKKYDYQRSFDSGRVTGAETGDVKRYLQNAISSFGGLDSGIDANGSPVVSVDTGRVVGIIARPGRDAPSEVITDGLTPKGASESFHMAVVVAPETPTILHASALRPAIADPLALLGEKGWIGLEELQPLSSSLARFFGREPGSGAVISIIGPGSPAEKAGLQVEDVLVAMHGEAVKGADADDIQLLQRRIRLSEVGSTLALKVLRDGQEKDFEVTVAAAPKSVYEAEVVVDEVFGVTVAEITYDVIQKKNLDPDDLGKVIVRKTPLAGWFSLAGLVPDDIVLGVNDQVIGDIDQFRTVMKKVAEERPEEVLVRVKRDAETRFVKVRPEW
ncbi:MAG: PDZ domain-containing protein [Planctomycetota bacterium]